MVKAAAQAAMAEALKDSLTEEELSVYRRGRNAKSPTMAKNASMSDYRKATGFEALMGYLYLENGSKSVFWSSSMQVVRITGIYSHARWVVAAGKSSDERSLADNDKIE